MQKKKKKQESVTCTQGQKKKQAIETVLDTQMLDLAKTSKQPL